MNINDGASPPISNYQIQLRDIPIPRFGGDIRCYHEFKRLFKELIDNAPIASLAKFHYLRDSLYGPALLELGDFPTAATNYNSSI